MDPRGRRARERPRRDARRPRKCAARRRAFPRTRDDRRGPCVGDRPARLPPDTAGRAGRGLDRLRADDSGVERERRDASPAHRCP